MEQHLDPDAPTPVSAERAVAVLAELSLDLLRAIQAAVPVALRETLDDVVEPALVERVAEVIFAETAARYRVAAAATLLAVSRSATADSTSPR
jgi:hypothetical protein